MAPVASDSEAEGTSSLPSIQNYELFAIDFIKDELLEVEQSNSRYYKLEKSLLFYAGYPLVLGTGGHEGPAVLLAELFYDLPSVFRDSG